MDIKESDVNWFEDGTRDKNNCVNVAISIDDVKDEIVNETLLTVTTTENLEVSTFTELTLCTLTENTINLLYANPML